MRSTGGSFVKKWMTVPEVAQRFSFSRSYVYELVSLGRFQALRPEAAVGKKGLRISVESVEQFEVECIIMKEI